MALALRDVRVGTVVDHDIERHGYDRAAEPDTPKSETWREEVRRGIIVGVVRRSRDSITAVKVKFKVDEDPVTVPAGELSKVYGANARQAREAYRRLMQIPKYTGSRFADPGRPVARKVVDDMALTPLRDDEGLVKPEIGRTPDIEIETGMDLPEEAV